MLPLKLALFTPAGQQLEGERYLVALNLHNSADVLPHQILQLVQVTGAHAAAGSSARKLLSMLAAREQASGQLSAPVRPCTLPCSSSNICVLQQSVPAADALLLHLVLRLPHSNVRAACLQLLAMLPSGDIVLSIYESGSSDSSPEWLELLRHLLELMHASTHIVVHGSERGDSGAQRIPQLAKLRNLALAPLWNSTGEQSDRGSLAAHYLVRASRRLVAHSTGCIQPQAACSCPAAGIKFLSRREQEGRAGFRADRVIFINDVFFCVNDVMRLVSQKVDLACGMDFQQQWPGLLAFYDTW